MLERTVFMRMVYLDALRRVSKDKPPKREPGRPFAHIKALAFDAYGTLFDVFSVTALCEQLFPGQGAALARLWRAKQLQYSLLRTVMGRYKDFWQLTDDGLRYAANSLHLDLSGPTHRQLMDAYLTLAAFPDVAPGLDALNGSGCDSPSCRTVHPTCSTPPRSTRALVPCSTRPSAPMRSASSSPVAASTGWRTHD